MLQQALRSPLLLIKLFQRCNSIGIRTLQLCRQASDCSHLLVERKLALMGRVLPKLQLPHSHFGVPLKGQSFLLEGFYFTHQAITLVRQVSILFPDGTGTCLFLSPLSNNDRGQNFPVTATFWALMSLPSKKKTPACISHLTKKN